MHERKIKWLVLQHMVRRGVNMNLSGVNMNLSEILLSLKRG